ncbi:MAG: lipid A biosynthesis lauroyl acyltransferase [Pseudomonadota bacterium]
MARLIRNPIVERVLFRIKDVTDWTVAKLVNLVIHLLKKLPPDTSTNVAEWTMRRIGFLFPRNKLARSNIALAFPEKSDAEVEEILKGMWGHVGRTIAEYIFLDELFDYDYWGGDPGRIDAHGVDEFVRIYQKGGGRMVMFTAHMGNWEMLPIAAATYDVNVTALFRPPNNKYIAKRVLKARTTSMGHLVPSKAGAAWALARVLEEDGAVGVLVDQHFTKGPEVEFFGRTARANPLVARLARRYDCPVYPARCVRLPGGKFRMDLFDPLELPRDDDGLIDVNASTQMINSIVEDWVREYPQQWLWIHDRWKDKKKKKRKRSAS